jgi:hypothetical protein
MSFWATWACFLWLQQFTFLFSGRAKASGSLKYSALAGIGSHMSWFISNTMFVASILEYKDAPWSVKLTVGAFYTFFALTGTLSAQWCALRWESGKASVGARG